MYKTIISIVILLLILTSCDDFLKEEAYDMKTSNSFFITEDDAEMAIIGTYSCLADAYRQSPIEMLTQNTGAFNKTSKTNEWVSGAYNAATKEVYQTWQYFFTLIDRANDVIANVSEMSVLEDQKKNAIIGEALFLRAWSYFVIVRMYLQAPIKLESTTGFENAYQALASSEEVYNEVIIPDLEFTFNHCPAEYPEAHSGRITQGAAAAALAKVYLTMAGADAASPHWETARTWAKWVIDNGKYELAGDFNDLWTKKNTPESIFEVQYLRGVITGSGYAKIFTPSKSGWAAKGGGWGRSACTQKNYDDFRFAYEGEGADLNLAPQDYRVKITFVDQYERIDNGKVTTMYPYAGYKKKNDSWPYIAKWKDAEAPDNFAGDNNFIVIRYADVLLMFAEAENEVNGPTAEAYDAVDLVLERARQADGTPRMQPANWERTLTREEFRDKVWNERRFELCAEQHLWFDLVRKGWDKFRTFKEADNAYGYKPQQHGVFEKGMYFPIPATEIAANDSIDISDQNPGY